MRISKRLPDDWEQWPRGAKKNYLKTNMTIVEMMEILLESIDVEKPDRPIQGAVTTGFAAEMLLNVMEDYDGD